MLKITDVSLQTPQAWGAYVGETFFIAVKVVENNWEAVKSLTSWDEVKTDFSTWTDVKNI
jgi:hypothetical protein